MNAKAATWQRTTTDPIDRILPDTVRLHGYLFCNKWHVSKINTLSQPNSVVQSSLFSYHPHKANVHSLNGVKRLFSQGRQKTILLAYQHRFFNVTCDAFADDTSRTYSNFRKTQILIRWKVRVRRLISNVKQDIANLFAVTNVTKL